MDKNKLTAAAEAIFFAYAEPLEIDKLVTFLETDLKTAENAVKELKNKYNSENSGMTFVETGGKYQIITKKEYAEVVKKALDVRKNTPLSAAAMEVLAIIAYNQPVSRSFVEQIRGVDCTYTIGSLEEKGLIEESHRLDIPGRPIAYKITDLFLRDFGIKSLDELPPTPKQEEENSQLELNISEEIEVSEPEPVL